VAQIIQDTLLRAVSEVKQPGAFQPGILDLKGTCGTLLPGALLTQHT
jgi:hypothetical protein